MDATSTQQGQADAVVHCRIGEREMKFDIQYEQEEDGRWLAEVMELPGVLTYGRTLDEAMAKVQALALRVLADRLERGESLPSRLMSISFASA